MAAVAAARPQVEVYSAETGKSVGQTPLPAVFLAPIRSDVVNFVYTNVAKNRRQPYAVSKHAGEQTSAQSWGTGRAVARIPRVSGGGTHRAGQGAFGNMCRGGRMFSPTKVWRNWSRKTNLNQRRVAVCSALAASALPALVMARGHRVDNVQEVPLVIDTDSLANVDKTKVAQAVLQRVGALDDCERVKASRSVRRGKGKMRNRRYVQRRGPLLVYAERTSQINAFRNIPGVEAVNVNHLNLLDLAPGGHLGRFCIWTKAAFERLEPLFGTFTSPSQEKKGFILPRAKLTNSDLTRIINSEEVQSHLRAAIVAKNFTPKRRNALRNKNRMAALNPYFKVQVKNSNQKVTKMSDKRKKALKKRRGDFYGTINASMGETKQ